MIRSAFLALTLLAGLSCTQTVPQGPVAQAPVFTVQPKDEYANVGSDAIFVVEVTPQHGVTFTWECRIRDTETWEPVDGGDTATLTLKSVITEQSLNTYRCVATNGFGSVTSETATLIVSTP